MARRYLDAISDGLREAMRADPGVILLGQDIAEYGGAFKVTAGFVEEFGKERVRNTPIVESAALGCALGLALDGFHPMVEMQFADFISCGFNQIVNNLATTHYRWGAPVPVVIRAPVGGGMAAGPFHSQNIEGYFANVPVSRSWLRRHRATPRASSWPPSRTPTPCCTWSTRRCTARAPARCRRGGTRCPSAKPVWPAPEATSPWSPGGGGGLGSGGGRRAGRRGRRRRGRGDRSALAPALGQAAA